MLPPPFDIFKGLHAAARKQKKELDAQKAAAEQEVLRQDREVNKVCLAQAFAPTPKEERDRILKLPQHFRDGTTNPEWLLARRHVMTGSKIAGLSGNGYNDAPTLLKHMLWPSTHSVNEMFTSYGNRHEATCELELIKYLGARVDDPDDDLVSFKIEHPGLIKDIGCFGYSPDGHVLETYKDGTTAVYLSEYKCPFGKRKIDPGPEHRGLDIYSQTSGKPTLYGPIVLPLPRNLGTTPQPLVTRFSGGRAPSLPITAYYYDQVQWGMALGQRQQLLRPRPGEAMKCYFVVWTPKYSQFCEVPFDKGYGDYLIGLATRFMKEDYFPTLQLKLDGHLPLGAIQPPSPPESPSNKVIDQWHHSRGDQPQSEHPEEV